MPWKRYGKCVFKITKSGKKKKKQGCSDSVDKAKDYLKALYANSGEVNEEIDDYFSRKDSEEENMFDHAETEDLIDPDMPAPWEKI
jgi:phage-related tail protein